MRLIALELSLLLGAACGQSNEGPVPEPAACGQELEKLREEMQWADSAIAYRGPDDLAQISEWTPSTLPQRFVSLRLGELEIDGKSVITLPDLTARVDSLSKQFPEQNPLELAQDVERSIDGDLDRALKDSLADFGDTPIVLAIAAREPWQFVRPVARALGKGSGPLRLLVSIPPPSWWDMRLVEESNAKTEGLGQLAHELSRRASEVFADCPAAKEVASAPPGTMLAYVEGIEACGCRVDPNASRALLHAIATPRIHPVGIIELTMVTHGEGEPFEAKPEAPWSAVLPRLVAASTPIILPDPPDPVIPPPPPEG